MKRKIAGLILLFFILPCLLGGCSQNGGDEQTPDSTATNTEAEKDAAEVEDVTEAPKIMPDVPDDLNFNGMQFRILYNRKTWANDWYVNGIEAEEDSGSPIDSAAYNRNIYLMEKYNFEIVTASDYDMSSAVIRRLISSGSDDFDAVITRGGEVAGLVTEGLFLDFTDVPGVDFDKPWWDRQMMEESSIANKIFFAYGDLIVVANNALRIAYFNKNVLQEMDYDMPYQMVREGKWTLDVFYNMCKDVYRDLNANGVIDVGDRFGLFNLWDIMPELSFNGDAPIYRKDENDLPYLTIGNERSLNIFAKLYEFIAPKNICLFESDFRNAGYNDNFDAPFIAMQHAFEENQALFIIEVLTLAERMRSSDTDFGLIPIPKYDEAQEKYYAYAAAGIMNFIMIPRTNTRVEETGLILELMNAESMYTLKPAYYDLNLNSKFVRDPESNEMLDIILEGRAMSLDDMYGWGMIGNVRNAFHRDGNVVAGIERALERVQRMMDRTVERILALE